MTSDIEFTKAELHALAEVTEYMVVPDENHEIQIDNPELAGYFDVPDGPSLAAFRTAYRKLDEWFMGDGEREDAPLTEPVPEYEPLSDEQRRRNVAAAVSGLPTPPNPEEGTT